VTVVECELDSLIIDFNTSSTGMIWVPVKMVRSAANHQGIVREFHSVWRVVTLCSNIHWLWWVNSSFLFYAAESRWFAPVYALKEVCSICLFSDSLQQKTLNWRSRSLPWKRLNENLLLRSGVKHLTFFCVKFECLFMFGLELLN